MLNNKDDEWQVKFKSFTVHTILTGQYPELPNKIELNPRIEQKDNRKTCLDFLNRIVNSHDDGKDHPVNQFVSPGTEGSIPRKDYVTELIRYLGHHYLAGTNKSEQRSLNCCRRGEKKDHFAKGAYRSQICV